MIDTAWGSGRLTDHPKDHITSIHVGLTPSVCRGRVELEPDEPGPHHQEPVDVCGVVDTPLTVWLLGVPEHFQDRCLERQKDPARLGSALFVRRRNLPKRRIPGGTSGVERAFRRTEVTG